jgi:homoserine O-acetyltransferase
VNASRNYDPSPPLEKIAGPVMFVHSADDFIHPPELGIAEREIKHVNNGRFILLPSARVATARTPRRRCGSNI